ncbi:MAG: hypothetical protein GDYSWBUE_000453 [Candidatus Fervidibacterota bacterium]
MKGFSWVYASIIGVLLFLIIAAVGWWRLSPKQKEIAQLSKTVEQLRSEASDEKLKQAEREREEARKFAAEARIRWMALKKRFHVFSFIADDQSELFWKWFREAIVDYEPQTRMFIARLARECGVRLVNYNLPTLQVSLQPPPPPQNGFMALGQFDITVEGDFPSILKFIERLPSGPRPMVVMMPRFEGVSPRLTATIPVSLLMICETEVERAALEGRAPPPTAQPAPQPATQPMPGPPGPPTLGPPASGPPGPPTSGPPASGPPAMHPKGPAPGGEGEGE